MPSEQVPGRRRNGCPGRVGIRSYRVAPEAKAEMDEAWKGCFSADPALEQRWHQAYRLYFAFLQSARRR